MPKKALFAFAFAMLASIGSAEALTVPATRYLNIQLDTTGLPATPVTFIFSPFDASAPSSNVLLRNQWFFPNPVIAGTWSSMTYWWKGALSPTKVTAADYILSGVLSFNAPNGVANLAFGPDHTWTCSGDCTLYSFWSPTGIFVPSSVILTSGIYSSHELPVPGALGMIATGLGALMATARFKRRFRAKPTLAA